MSAQTPGSYTASLLIHAGVVGLMFGLGWFMQTQMREPVKVFDLVAGAGDNWAATEAPALGSESGSEDIKIPNMPATMPKIDDPTPPSSPEPSAPIPAPEPEPLPIKPAPLPKNTPPPDTSKATKEPAPLDTKKTTLTQDFKRLQEKRYNRKMDQFRKQQAAAEAKAKKEAEAAKKKMTEEEFRRQNAGKGGGGSIAKIDAKGIAGGVVGGSTKNTKGGAGGTAMTAEEASLMERYYAFLKQRVKAAHIPPPGAGDRLSTTVEFHCAADGVLSRMRVVSSSGNPEFDQSVIEAFKRVRGIGARPDGKSELLEIEFKAMED